MMQMSHNQRLTLKPYPDSFLLFLLHSSKLSIVLCGQDYFTCTNNSKKICNFKENDGQPKNGGDDQNDASG